MINIDIKHPARSSSACTNLETQKPRKEKVFTDANLGLIIDNLNEIVIKRAEYKLKENCAK